MKEENNNARLLQYVVMYVDIKTTCYSFKIEEPAVQEIRLLLHPHQIIMIFKETQ